MTILKTAARETIRMSVDLFLLAIHSVPKNRSLRPGSNVELYMCRT